MSRAKEILKKRRKTVTSLQNKLLANHLSKEEKKKIKLQIMYQQQEISKVLANPLDCTEYRNKNVFINNTEVHLRDCKNCPSYQYFDGKPRCRAYFADAITTAIPTHICKVYHPYFRGEINE